MLRLITRFGKYLALTPSGPVSLPSKLYSVLVAFVMITCSIISAAVYRRPAYAGFTDIKIIVTVCMVITVNLFCCFAIVVPVLRNSTKYCNFMETLLRTKPANNRHKILFATTNLVYWMISAYAAYVWVDILGPNYYNEYLVEVVQLYMQYYYTFFLYAVIKEIKARYSNINAILTKMDRVKSLEPIRRVESAFFQLKEFTVAFNELFGWPILMIILYSNLLMLSYLNEIIRSNFAYDYEQYIGVIASNVSVVVMTNIGTLALVLGCDSVLREAQKSVVLTYKLRHFVRERRQLFDFLRFLQDNQPQFTGAGFFTIDKSAVFSMAGTVTTFFIVMVQFNTNTK